jgi:soluble lytic murein transglycosylase-like protein
MPAALILISAIAILAGLALLARPAEASAIASSSPGGAGDDLALGSAGGSQLLETEPLVVARAPDPGPGGAQLLDAFGAALSSLWKPPAKAAPYLEAIGRAELEHGLPANLLARQLQAESNFDPKAVSHAGAQGIAQFMPATARDLRVDPFNPFTAIDAAARYMRSLYDQTGSWRDALAAYNWGIGNVLRKGTERLPAETARYVASITADVPVDS